MNKRKPAFDIFGKFLLYLITVQCSSGNPAITVLGEFFLSLEFQIGPQSNKLLWLTEGRC